MFFKDRVLIERMLKEDIPKGDISKMIQVARKTIYNEINSIPTTSYSAFNSQALKIKGWKGGENK